MGWSHTNPVFNTCIYNVQFEDGDVTELMTNLIAEFMYAQCDPNGNQYLLLNQLVDHRSNNKAVLAADQTVHRDKGRTYQHERTTAGWQLC
jgi:hypothetical protein